LIKTIFVLLLSLHCFAQDDGSHELKPSKLLETEAKHERLSFTKYHPVYFAYGNPTTKLQFSFKYQTFVWMPLYFGYTQVMFWKLSQESLPFKDLNYAPEIFYRFEVKNRILESVDFSPVAHLSNGRDGGASRTLNRAYVRTNLKTPLSEGEVKISATFYGYYNLGEENADLYDYVGPLDLKFTVTQFVPWILDRGELYVRVFPGGSYAERWDRGGQELGLSFRIGGLGLNPSIYFQYYNGYAESLLDYNHLESSFRGGIIL